MTEQEANAVITKAFTDAWPAVSGGVPYTLENRSLALPASGSFAYLDIVATTSDLMTTGAAGTRMEIRRGWVQVKLWAQAGQGTDTAKALADAVRSIFNRKVISAATPGEEPINTESTSTQPVGNDGKWLTQLSRTRFWYVTRV